MQVTILCPNLNCGKTVVAPDTMRGKVVRCAHCNQPFLVPILRTGIVNKDADAKKKTPAKNS